MSASCDKQFIQRLLILGSKGASIAPPTRDFLLDQLREGREGPPHTLSLLQNRARHFPRLTGLTPLFFQPHQALLLMHANHSIGLAP